MAGAEAIAAVQLIDACIGITKTILDIGRAVKDAQGLPPKLRNLCEKLPAIEELLEIAHDSCDEGRVNEENSEGAQPILKQCEQALAELRDIFRKACPKAEDDRTKRIWRGARTVFFGRDGQVQKLLVAVQDNLRLLEQKEIFRIGDRLEELQQLTEALAQDEDGKITHSGSGNILANQGGSHTNYLMSGSGRQVNNPGVYNEGPSTHTHIYHQTTRSSVQSSFLSVDSSVAGLISIAGQLVPALYDFGSAIKEADKEARAAATEVAGMSVVLQGLQAYITGRSRANPQRLRLITVEHITASLTACVLTYSELDAVLKSLNAGSELTSWDRAVWFVKRGSIENLISRIQNHKSTFTCMLNILQCDSALEAEKNMNHVCDQVDRLHRDNEELSARLRNLEYSSGSGSLRRSTVVGTINSIRKDHGSSYAQSTTSTSSHEKSLGSKRSGFVSLPGSVGSTVDQKEPVHRSAFEEQLHRSRVYRHAEANHSESSFTDDGCSTLALSICSSLTLGEVSNISVFAIPIFADELSNALAYDFTRPNECAMISIPDRTDPNFQELETVKNRRNEVQSKRNFLGMWTFFRTKKRRQRQELPSALQEQSTPYCYSFALLVEMIADWDALSVPGIFGVPLHTSIRYANVAISLFNDEGQSYIYGYVPIIVAKIGFFLKEKATECENVFATGSSPLRVQELQLAFDSTERYGKGLDLTGYTVHDAANILLRYFLQLPEPVIPLGFYERFRDPFLGHSACYDLRVGDNTFDLDATIRLYQALITELPPLDRQLFLYMLDLLAVFASKSDLNKMTSSKMAAIFQPGILSHPQHSSSIAENRLSEGVLIFLIEEQDNFLFGMPGTAANHEESTEVPKRTANTGETPTPLLVVSRSQSCLSTSKPTRASQPRLCKSHEDIRNSGLGYQSDEVNSNRSFKTPSSDRASFFSAASQTGSTSSSIQHAFGHVHELISFDAKPARSDGCDT